MTRTIPPTRTLIALFCAALSLFPTPRPIARSIPSTTLEKTIRLQTLSSLAVISLVALLPQNTHAIAVPEMVRGYPYNAQELNARGDEGLARRNWTSAAPDCEDSTTTEAALPTGTLAGYSSVQPVTITVTVFPPNSTNVPSPSTAPGYTSGTPSMNGTVASGSTSLSTRTSTSSIPVGTVGPILASAQEAQRLNLAFQSLKASDPCTPGQRACISSQIAQCSVPSSTSDSPRWVTQTCVISSDPSQTPVCAALPDFNANSTTTTTPGAIANTTSSSSPVVLGCFNPTDITQAFNTAGAQGGFLPPGTQASAAPRLLKGKAIGGFELVALMALIVTILL